jgi:polyhydroxyalkanoate synthesis repressor PhaR
MAGKPKTTYHITKYPNRRLYDATSRQYVTLSELYEFVRQGHDIAVTDKATGRDITNVVLTQIILEHDPPKMDLFPASLLHQAIQMNESTARSFIDRYLTQAMDAFSQSRRQFDAFLRQSGIPSMAAVAPPLDWMRMVMPGMVPPTRPQTDPAESDRQSAPSDDPEPSPAPDSEIEALRRQIAELGEQMAQIRNPKARDTRPAGKKPVRKKKTRKK